LSTWIQTYSGLKFDIDNLNPDMITIRDIAHALSLNCRYNGHCKQFYSVAEHCVLMSENVLPEYAMDALLHDAAEAYLTDIPRPFKPLIVGFEDLEYKVLRTIYKKFGLIYPDWETRKEIKQADLIMLKVEQRDVMSTPPEKWACLEGVEIWPEFGGLELWTPAHAEEYFQETFHNLYYR
jgi:uncharacterized protein